MISYETRNQRIVKRYLAGERVSDIAKRYGITPARVSQIVSPVHNRNRVIVSRHD